MAAAPPGFGVRARTHKTPTAKFAKLQTARAFAGSVRTLGPKDLFVFPLLDGFESSGFRVQGPEDMGTSERKRVPSGLTS